MIRIDLLPAEFRRAERTAPAVFLATIGLVVVACTALAGCGYGWFFVVGGARGETQQAQERLDNLKPRAEYCDRLEAEKKEFGARLDHIKEFSDSRILWTKKLDVLASMIDAPPEPYKYNVWLESLQMEMVSGRRMGISVKGQSDSAEVRRVSNFHSALKAPAFFSGFASISNPAAKVVVDEDFDPKESCEYEFKLDLIDKTADSAGDKKKKPAAKAKK